MKISLLGKKIGMTRIFKDDGVAVAVTVVKVEPSVVTAVKTVEKDGYSAIQLGYGDVKEKNVNKPRKGFFEKIGVKPKRRLYEVRVDGPVEGVKPGDILGVENFEKGDYVDVSGLSKGRGFQGVVKRHGFSGGRGSHGDKTGRRPGSIGQSAYPSRVFKGMLGPGRMGGKRVAVQNLEIVDVDFEDMLLLVEGAVPGPNGGVVEIAVSLKKGKDKELKVVSPEPEVPEEEGNSEEGVGNSGENLEKVGEGLEKGSPEEVEVTETNDNDKKEE